MIKYILLSILIFVNVFCSSSIDYDFFPPHINEKISFYLNQYNEFPEENIFLIKIAEILYKENYLNESSNYLKLAENNEPDIQDKKQIYLLKAKIYEKQKNFSNAIESILELLKISDNIEYNIYLADLYFQDGNYSGSFNILNQIHSNNPNNLTVLNKLGSYHIKINQYKEAEKYLQKILSVDFTNIPAMYNLVLLYQETGNQDKFISNLNKIITYGKNTGLKEVALAYGIKSDLALNEGNLNAALEYLKNGINIDKTQWPLHNKIAELYLKKYLFTEAIDSYKTANNLNPDNYSIIENIGDIYYSNLDEVSIALSYYLDALTLNQNSTKLLYKVGSIYYDNEEYQKTIFYLERIADLNKDDFYTMEAYVKIIDMLQKYENYPIAIRRTYEAINLFEDFYLFYFILGDLYKITNNYDKAIDNYLHSIKLNPEYDMSHINLGTLYYEIKEYDKAMHYLTIALELNDEIEIQTRLEILIEKILEENE